MTCTCLTFSVSLCVCRSRGGTQILHYSHDGGKGTLARLCPRLSDVPSEQHPTEHPHPGAGAPGWEACLRAGSLNMQRPRWDPAKQQICLLAGDVY